MATSRSTTRMLHQSKPFFLHSRYNSTHTIPQTSTFAHTTPVVPIDYSTTSTSVSQTSTSNQSEANMPPPLSILSLTSLLRSIMINSISCSPVLLPPSLVVMDKLAHSTSPILNPDQNPILKYFLKKTFYAQFCAGETPAEVAKTVSSLKALGFRGVALGYAKEVVLDEGAVKKLASCGDNSAAEECIRTEILPWKEGTLKTLEITTPGEFVSIKFTGAGSQALFNLSQNQSPSPALDAAITEICDLASKRGVRLLFDAEQQSLQKGIDTWTIHYMRKYNKKSVTIYNTYQCYLKAVPEILANHLTIARKENFVLGTKLVRGAYLGSDPRHLINDTKEDTDRQYDGVAEALMKRQYNETLKPAAGEENQPFPRLCMVLAGHNHTSVRKALAIRSEQARKGEERVDMVYATLQGMADEVSCDLLQAGKLEMAKKEPSAKEAVEIPMAFKYLVWGTTGECMKYLLRRARENKDAVGRTREGRDAMVSEVVRRMKSSLGFS